MSAILIKELSKRIGKGKVFSDFNLEVPEGEFFALLAPEKRGKTTLFRILFNFLKPNKGKVYIFDMDTVKDSKIIKESVGFVPNEVMLRENVKASSIFNKTLSAHNLKNKDELEKLLDYFGFNERLRIGEMTEREKRIFTIINALLFKPRLVVFDNATNELNQDDLTKLFTYLKDLKREENLTVFLLSDNLSLAQSYCDRVAIISEGAVKDIEYTNDKLSNDKKIIVKENIGDLNEFTKVGARVIRDELNHKELYYNGDLRKISKILFDLDIINYSILDSTLEDKINALKEGPLPKFENERERDEVPEIIDFKNQTMYEQTYIEEVDNPIDVEETTEDNVEETTEDNNVFESSYENREDRDFSETFNDETLVIDKDSENSNFTDSNSQTINFSYKQKEEE